jgi:hypothetical protein
MSMVEKILASFGVPKTPKRAEKELELKKIKMKPLIEKKLVVLLNPKAKKGRLYVTTEKAKKFSG